MPRGLSIDLSTSILFVLVRIVPSLAFPVIAGRRVKLYDNE
jgi:hypothetical protein